MKQWYLKFRGRPLDTSQVASQTYLPATTTVGTNFTTCEQTPTAQLRDAGNRNLWPHPGPTLQLLLKAYSTHVDTLYVAAFPVHKQTYEQTSSGIEKDSLICLQSTYYILNLDRKTLNSYSDILDNMNTMHLIVLILVEN